MLGSLQAPTALDAWGGAVRGNDGGRCWLARRLQQRLYNVTDCRLGEVRTANADAAPGCQLETAALRNSAISQTSADFVYLALLSSARDWTSPPGRCHTNSPWCMLLLRCLRMRCVAFSQLATSGGASSCYPVVISLLLSCPIPTTLLTDVLRRFRARRLRPLGSPVICSPDDL